MSHVDYRLVDIDIHIYPSICLSIHHIYPYLMGLLLRLFQFLVVAGTTSYILRCTTVNVGKPSVSGYRATSRTWTRWSRGSNNDLCSLNKLLRSHSTPSTLSSTRPDLIPIRPCWVEMWVPRVNFLTLIRKKNLHEFRVTTVRTTKFC